MKEIKYMEIILKNLPESNDEVYLLIEPSLLNQNEKIFYNINEINNEIRNEIILSQNKYKYNNIYTTIEKEFFSNLFSNQLNKKIDTNILILLNKDEDKSEKNIFSSIKDELSNLFSKDFFDKNNLRQVLHNYYKISLDKNSIDNSIKDKIFNKDSETFNIELTDDDINNTDLALLKMQFDYLDDIVNIPSFINIYFIYNTYEKILPLFSINKKDKEILLLKEKINNLLSFENDIKEKISKLPILNNDFIQEANVYKDEVMNYYGNLVKENKKETKNKNNNSNKNALTDLIKESKNLIENINKEQFKNKEKTIYQKYIEVYSNNNQIFNNFDIQELKKSINHFNNLNEEILEFLEKEKSKAESNDKDKEISKLKQRIKQLEKDLNSQNKKIEEKNTNIQSKNSKSNQRSISAIKINNKININNYNSNEPKIQKLEEENKKLKKNIEELKETISALKSKNNTLIKEKSKISKEKNITSSNNSLKNNIKENPSIYNSPKKSINQNIDNSSTTSKKVKSLNKTKTNKDFLFNGNSLLLLKKIQEENKELSKQLKDFNSKNFQLELSLKGINNGEIKNQAKNNNSLLFNFTKNTRGELKNIEKKYGLTKNK